MIIEMHCAANLETGFEETFCKRSSQSIIRREVSMRLSQWVSPTSVITVRSNGRHLRTFTVCWALPWVLYVYLILISILCCYHHSTNEEMVCILFAKLCLRRNSESQNSVRSSNKLSLTEGDQNRLPQICQRSILCWIKVTEKKQLVQEEHSDPPLSPWKQEVTIPCDRCPPCTRREKDLLINRDGKVRAKKAI